MAANQSFPAKIYQILENESSDIIRWNDDGQTFRIVDHGRFEREIVPKYFRHNQISSVQRQLNLYGFKCISRGELRRSFFHPKFKRGDWEVVKKLTRYVPPKKPLPYQEYGSSKNDNTSEFARSAASVVVMKEEPNTVTQSLSEGNKNWPQHAANTLSAVASAAGLLPPSLSMPYPAPQSGTSSLNDTPRSSQPSQLAMRLGFNVMPKPTGTLQANPIVGNSNSAPAQQSFGSCTHHGSNPDFDLLKDFDFFDNLHFDELAFMNFPASKDTAATSSPLECSSSESVSASSTATEVVPVLMESSVIKTEMKDAECMTDLVYSEQHGGFIYRSN